MLSKTLGIVFSNMHDTMMGKLTENRTMASEPFERISRRKISLCV